MTPVRQFLGTIAFCAFVVLVAWRVGWLVSASHDCEAEGNHWAAEKFGGHCEESP